MAKPKPIEIPSEPKPLKKMRLKDEKREYMNGHRRGIYDRRSAKNGNIDPHSVNPFMQLTPQWHGWWKGWLDEHWNITRLKPEGTPETLNEDWKPREPGGEA